MAQEAFYLNMGLPVYVRTASSDSFAASVVEQGHALLFYNGTKLRAKLPSGNYIDIGGSSSTDFSVVTATADDVLAPKQFYNNAGNRVTGNIQTVTVSLDGNTVRVPKGYIAASDSITVSGGIDIQAGYINAEGKFQPLSFNGTEASDSGSAVEGLSVKIFNTGVQEPEYPTGQGSTDFYKCMYVSSDSSFIWRGRKAVFNDGVYSFQSNSTSGLVYSSVKPVVGNCYDATALIQANLYLGIPTQDLVLYVPLRSSIQASTGQSVSSQGLDTITFGEVDGIRCATLDTTRLVISQLTGFPSGTQPWTLSVWAKWDGQFSGNDDAHIVFWGQSSPGQSAYICIRSGYQRVGFGFHSDDHNTNIEATTWKHLLYTFSGTVGTLYVDGQQQAYFNAQAYDGIYLNRFTIGGHVTQDICYFNGSISAVRLYSRVLSPSQIQALANEFTPMV